MRNRDPIRNRKPSEEGFILLVAVFMLALLVLLLSIAVPVITRQIQRDREVETMHRGKQYQRAIQLYFRKFGAYPPNINALVNTNNIRFLRKRYTDPMTGMDDWKPILYGQNKAPLALGFFGEPLAAGATALAGVGPGGGNGVAGVPGLGGNAASSGFGTSTFGSSTFGGTNSNSPSAGASTGPGTAGAAAGTDANGAATSGAGSATGTSSGGSTSSGLSSLSGQTFGGGGIIGFSPGRNGRSILLYKKMDQYNQWEFTYSPLMEIKAPGSPATGLPGQPAGVNQNGTGFGTGGTGLVGSGFGGTGLGGSSVGQGSAPGTTPVPQQSQ